MAKRPSIQEILAAARQSGPTPTAADAPLPTTTSTAGATATAPPRLADGPPVPVLRSSLQEKLDKAAAERGSRAGAPQRLTLQEKLDKAAAERNARAEARSGGSSIASPPSTPASTPARAASAEGMSVKEKLAAARNNGTNGNATVSAPATAVTTSEKGMSVKDKLAAARGLTPAPAASPPTPSPVPTPAPIEPTTPATVPSTSGPKSSEPKELADALRRTGAKKDEEHALRAISDAVEPAGRAATSHVGRPERSILQIDRNGVLLFASWRVVFAGLMLGTLALLAAKWILG